MHRSVFAILGAGNEAQGLAGILTLRGYDVRVYNRSDARLAPLRQAGGIQLAGAVEGFARLGLLTSRMEEAVDGADIVMIPIPAYGHRFISETLAPVVRPGQTVIFQPGSLGSALECLRILRERGVHDVVVAETETCLCTARIVGPAKVNVRAIKQQVRVAAVPATATGTVVEQLRAPSEGHYAAAESVLEIALDPKAQQISLACPAAGELRGTLRSASRVAPKQNCEVGGDLAYGPGRSSQPSRSPGELRATRVHQQPTVGDYRRPLPTEVGRVATSPVKR